MSLSEDEQYKYDVAVQLYNDLIYYARNHQISSIKDLKSAIAKDAEIDPYTQEVYVERLKYLNNNVIKIFKRNGIE